MSYHEVKRKDAHKRKRKLVNSWQLQDRDRHLNAKDEAAENAGRRLDSAIASREKLAAEAATTAAVERPAGHIFDAASIYLIPANNSSTDPGFDLEIDALPERLARAARNKQRTNQMAAYLWDRDNELAQKLASCNTFRLFRHWYETGDCRLIAAKTCKRDRLCPVCANLRAGRNAARYHKRLQVVQSESQHKFTEYMWTFTVKDGDDLGERLSHLRKGLRVLVDHRRKVRNGVGRHTWMPFCATAGGVYSIEITKGKNSGQWHPHVHVYALHDQPIRVLNNRSSEMEQWWRDRLGDSYVVDVRPVAAEDRGSAIVEVLKYSAKFSSMTLAENWEAYQVTTAERMRLLGSFGVLQGVPDVKVLTDEMSDSDGDFVDLAFRYDGHCFQPERKTACA